MTKVICDIKMNAHIHVAQCVSLPHLQPVYTTSRIALNRFASNRFNYRSTSGAESDQFDPWNRIYTRSVYYMTTISIQFDLI